MKIGNILLLIIFTHFFAVKDADAQAVSIQATVNKSTISIGEQFSLQVTVSGNVSQVPQPQLPKLDEFVAYSSGRSQQISIINGKMSTTVIFNYTLLPKSPGKHTIGPISISIQNQQYQTTPIIIEVAVKPQKTPSTPTKPHAKVRKKGKPKDNIFIKTSVDKKKAYVNEQITLSFRFYRRVRPLTQPQYSPPDTTGFWAEDLPPQRNHYTQVQGTQYLVTEIKTALFPTSPGQYTIGPARLQVGIEDFSSDDFFSGFFSPVKKKLLETKPIRTAVLHLPRQNRPRGFSGTVGDYRLSVSVDKTRVKVNEPVTLTVTVSGTGNVKTISEPKIPRLISLKKYQTVSSFNLSKKNDIVQGSKSYKTVLVPQRSGKIVIPAISFSFFNPKLKTYKTARTKSVELKVTAAPTSQTKTSPMIISPEGIKLLEKDIRYIKTKSKLKKSAKELYRSGFFVIANIFPLIFLVVTWRYKKYSEKMNKDIAYARSKKAYSQVKNRLNEAKILMYPGSHKEFLGVLHQALSFYLADKLNVPAAGITLDRITNNLTKRNIPKNIIDQIHHLGERFDYLRFTSATPNSQELLQLFKNTEDIITIIDKKW